MAIALGSKINEVIQNSLRKTHPILGTLVIYWRDIIGEELSNKTTPLRVTSYNTKAEKINILLIETENPCIAMELSYKQGIIIERIAVYMGYKAINKIKIISRK